MNATDSENINAFKLLNKIDIWLSVIQTGLLFLVYLFNRILISNSEQTSLIYFILSTIFSVLLLINFVIWGIYKMKQFMLWKKFSDEFKKTQNIFFIVLIVSTFSGFICPIIIYYILTQLPDQDSDNDIKELEDEDNSVDLIN
ncbi:MAG: hypothetical protein KFW07_03530 [Mycoplasmataceae bacterium]|nr:hypothetical protein [Mycoplasmataceae bacterium]